jgi:hypothetical protein
VTQVKQSHRSIGFTPLITVCWYSSALLHEGQLNSGAATSGVEVKIADRWPCFRRPSNSDMFVG